MNIDDLQTLQLGDWTLKVYAPDTITRVIFLVHGWTGDERSMWAFASRMPQDALLIAPRAPYPSGHPSLAGYSWVPARGGQFSRRPDFAPALAGFEGLLGDLAARFPDADFSHFDLVGFSQGGAFDFAFALAHPERVDRLAALASFLPDGEPSDLSRLAGKPVFMAHGTQDDTVPVAMARQASQALQDAGVRVQYCEAETGHKLAAECARQLAEFMQSS